MILLPIPQSDLCFSRYRFPGLRSSYPVLIQRLSGILDSRKQSALSNTDSATVAKTDHVHVTGAPDDSGLGVHIVDNYIGFIAFLIFHISSDNIEHMFQSYHKAFKNWHWGFAQKIIRKYVRIYPCQELHKMLQYSYAEANKCSHFGAA